MKAQWQQGSARFAALSMRERAMVAAAAVFGLGFLVYNFAVEPPLLKSRSAAKTVQRVQSEIAQMQAQLAAIKSQGFDPDASNRARLDQLKQQMAATGGRLQTFEARMVQPEKMQAVLEGLLTRDRRLELLSLKTLPATQVGAPEKKAEAAGGTAAIPAAAPAAAKPPVEGIYRHGVEIRLAGSYNDLLNYLAELESMPQRVMWNSVSLTVDKYPRNILTLHIHTLSLDRTWLTV